MNALLPIIATLLLSTTALAQDHRYGLFIGNDEGGPETKTLLYAQDDARRMHDTFTRLARVKPEDAMLLLDSNAKTVDGALSELERRIADAKSRGERTTLFLYYSGHAKDGALRLGASQLPFEELKQRLTAGPADVRVAIFDACRSGTVTRSKGVRRAPSFEVETDATRQAKGLVLLTSSAADEDSQESDVIGASYFSYHLATALLGSADSSGDGRVTLNEAYGWAYERTVASTADSAAGPQHPTFSFDLAGNGDLVLTDVMERREGLHLPQAAPQGPYFVIDSRGVIVAETVKLADPRLIALPPGTYKVKRRLPDRLRVGEFTITAGQIYTLDESTLENAKFTDDPVKGTGISKTYSRHWSLSAFGQYQAVFDRPTSNGGYFPSAPAVGGEVTVHNIIGRGFGLGIDAGYGWTSNTVNVELVGLLPYDYSLVTIGASAIYEWFQEGRWIPFVGLHLAFNIMSRSFEDTSLAAQNYSIFTPGIVAGLKVRIAGNFSVIGRARVHYLHYNVDETRSLGNADFGLLLDYEFRD
ncbi:MAG: peptidase C14 [Archangium gephyra]|uniref:Peptidase C14 n=1 Tax=Archangium gephyra TaxID=48 RepID=A0A2W5TA27_9BACT|nr:MAG: peptidase C14 [Archangium gephyra]